MQRNDLKLAAPVRAIVAYAYGNFGEYDKLGAAQHAGSQSISRGKSSLPLRNFRLVEKSGTKPVRTS